MRIAVVGCAHGELDQIYDSVHRIQQNKKIDLIICCGDFQATRNESDLRCMAVPEKFYNMGSFYKYYSGEKKAPVLTIFIGGNHEASNFLQELPYGGWVAPKIYYIGYAGVVKVGNLRVGGLSGIFKPFDYMKGHHERAPYNSNSLRSVYHVRNIEVFRLKQVSGSIDVMLSHDWPRGVYNFGSINELLKNKPFFERDVKGNKLGSEPCEELLFHLKPKYWFSAHLHTKFSALVLHNSTNDCEEEQRENSSTSFLALDKCLPRRKYLEVVEISSGEDEPEPELYYDLEWLTILHLTDHLMSSRKTMTYMPNSKSSTERWMFTPTDEEKDFVLRKMNKDLKIPQNFEPTARCYEYDNKRLCRRSLQSPKAVPNPQTETFCQRLGIKDPIGGFENQNSSNFENSFSTPEKTEFSTFISSNDDGLEEFSATSVSSRKEEFEERGGVELSQNENFLANYTDDFTNDRVSSTDYISFIEKSSFSDRSTSTPNYQKKAKYDFPSFKESDNENSDTLPIEINRSGNTSLIKRRNANIYQD